MKKRNKIIAVLLAAASLATVSGCGKKQTAVSSDGEYVPSKELKLTVWETQGSDYAAKPELEDNIVQKWLEDKTKVKIETVYGNDGSNWDPKLTKLVAGDNLPDIVHCGAGQGAAHFAKLQRLGKVWELTPEILQKYAPEVWRRTPDWMWDKLTIDGKIMGIPYSMPITLAEYIFDGYSDEELAFVKEMKYIPTTDVTYSGSQNLWIRDDILKHFYPECKTYDELAAVVSEKNEPIGDMLLDIPIKSTDEFVEFMYKIKDAGFKENNKTVYAYGYEGGDNWSALTWFGADMMGYKNHAYTATWNSKTQSIEIPLVHDIIYETAKIQNKMVNDKVIDPESLSDTFNIYKEKVLNGQYAIVPLEAIDVPSNVNNQLAKDGKSFRYRPFITQVPAREGYEAFTSAPQWGESLCILKTVDEEGLHQILNWINTQYTDEYEQIVNWGPPEAGLYTEDENGVRTFKDDRFTKYFIEGDSQALSAEETKGLQGPRQAGYNVGGQFGVYFSKFSKWNPEINNKVVKFTATSGSGFKFPVTSEHVTNVKVFPPCQAWSAEYAEIPELVKYWSEREQWEVKFKIALAAGTDEFDNVWQKAIDNLNTVVDIDQLEKKMTEVAKPLSKDLEER